MMTGRIGLEINSFFSSANHIIPEFPVLVVVWTVVWVILRVVVLFVQNIKLNQKFSNRRIITPNQSFLNKKRLLKQEETANKTINREKWTASPASKNFSTCDT